MQKKKILGAIVTNRANYPSDTEYAAPLGISISMYSAIKNSRADGALSEGTWIGAVRRLGVSLHIDMGWKAAKTATFEYITAQLGFSQQSSLSAILCDIPNIGKMFMARYRMQNHRNIVYIDCSQVKTKPKLVRKIASESGVDGKRRYSDVYEDLVYYFRSMETPLVTLDEADDLQYEAFFELKVLWNATEQCCAWYVMGVDGLKEKTNRSIECKKAGYTEMLSCYGDRYSRVIPGDGREHEAFLNTQARAVAKVNALEEVDAARIVRKTRGGLRKVYTEIEKLRMTAQ